jgi:N-acetyl-gamma-glutamyl-phosphate reductase
VVGATGYSGAELVGLLLGHPEVELVGLFGSQGRQEPILFGELFGRFRGLTDLAVQPAEIAEVAALDPDAVFLATPSEVSHALAPPLLERGYVVLDFSGAFRLPDASLYPQHYGFAHERPDLLAEAAYGLPERNRAAIAAADLIALPGCYPTSAILPTAPLVAAGIVDPGGPVIVDSASGVSGAGRTASLRSHYCEVSFQPYGVLAHRHGPEIRVHGGAPVVFTPHLGPWDRGILSTIHVPLAPGIDERGVRGVLEGAYAGEPFVRLLPPGTWPSIGAVRATNFCDIGLAVHGPSRHLIACSAIDNLIKGAAGQAVQCLNVRFGVAQTQGLLAEAPCPVH